MVKIKKVKIINLLFEIPTTCALQWINKVCKHASTHRSTHSHIIMIMYTHMHIHICTHMHAHTCIHMYPHTRIHNCIHVHKYVHIYIPTHRHTQTHWIHTHIHTCTHVHKYAHIYTQAHWTHTYTNTQICIQKCTHTHTEKQANLDSCPCAAWWLMQIFVVFPAEETVIFCFWSSLTAALMLSCACT